MRLVVLLPRVPYPIEKGDKLRAYNFIRELSQYHEIYLFAIAETKVKQESINNLKQFCKDVHVAPISKMNILLNMTKAFFQGLPLQIGFYTSPKIKNDFNNYIDKVKPDQIFCQLIRVAEYVKNLDIPKTIDIQDTMSLNIKRNIKTLQAFLRPIYKIEAKRLQKYECDIFEKFDNKILISQPDRDAYPHSDRAEIKIIPNGVDFDFFHPILDAQKVNDVVFTGNMGYIPNIDASIFLVKDILPIVKEKYPDVKFVIAGANPPKKLRKLASDNVIVTGWVEDIRNCYATAKVFIAPMRIGTGLQNKLLEAMAMKIPCITTPLANEALCAKTKENILVAKSKDDLAAHIITLLENKEYADKLADNAYRFVTKSYSWEQAGVMLNDLIINTVKK